MRYPSFLNIGDTIGIIAPSFGVATFPYNERYQSAKKKFIELGYKVKECPSLFTQIGAASNTAKIRAQEFMDMYLDDEVDFLISAGGGEIMCEILPYLDFELLKKAKPKYVQGFSDNTNITFIMNTMLDTASIYGICAPTFGMEKWSKSIVDAMEIIQGKRLTQDSYPQYVNAERKPDIGHALDGYEYDSDTDIQSLDGKDCVMEGRLVGGCLDVLDLIVGTPFDHFQEFSEKYKDDGIILFIEACELSVMGQYRSYWKMKQCGWLNNVKGIIVGRAYTDEECFGYDVMKALSEMFKEYNIPIVYGLDIGHKPPIWNVISGSYTRIEKVHNKCRIEYILK